MRTHLAALLSVTCAVACSLPSSTRPDQGERRVQDRRFPPQEATGESSLSKDGSGNGSESVFSYLVIDKRIQDSSKAATYGLAGSQPLTINVEEVFVQFEDSTPQQLIDSYLQDLSARVVRQIVLPGSPDGKLPPKVTRTYLVAFDYNLPADDLADLAPIIGMQGRFVFSDKRVAVILQQVIKSLMARSRYGLKHIGIAHSGTESQTTWPEHTWREGDGFISPDSAPFWFQGPYESNIKGNRISKAFTSDNDCVYYTENGYGVNVAVIDNGFLNAGEPLNPQLLGGMYSSTWAYNFIDRNYDAQNFAGHGRWTTSLIFSVPGDSKGTAGVAISARPFLFHVDIANQNQEAEAIMTAAYWGAKVINMSWGVYWPGWALPTLLPIYGPLRDANAQGIILVAATGNEGDGDFYPAGYSEVMGVGGHDQQGNVPQSCSGKTLNTWHADIYAAAKDVGVANFQPAPNIGVQTVCPGTSVAAPIVSGACALYYRQGKINSTASAISKLRRDAWYYQNRPILDVYYGLKY